MKLLFRQRFFSWFDSYDIYDENENTVYTVKGQLSWGHCLKIYDVAGREVGTVKERVFTFHQGFLNYFDRSGSAFISARRKYKENHIDFEIRFDSIYTPSLEGKQLLLVDPMLATGASIVVAYHELLKQGGRPAHTHIAAIVSSRQGIERLTEALKDEPVTVWTGALDEHLTESCYIDPGIGDAGDLAFGEKL